MDGARTEFVTTHLSPQSSEKESVNPQERFLRGVQGALSNLDRKYQKESRDKQ